MIVKNFAIRMEYGALLVYIKIFIHRGDFMEEVNLQEMSGAAICKPSCCISIKKASSALP